MASVVSVLPRMWCAQKNQINKSNEQEQTEFDFETEPNPVKMPAKLSAEALSTLSRDRRIASCLGFNGIRPEQLPANWFLASVAHLDGENEEDLIVMPGGPLPDSIANRPSANACLVASFWIPRPTSEGFEMILSHPGSDLDVLPTRTNGFRDIRLGAADGGFGMENFFSFYDRTYRIARRSSQMVWAEVPSDLSTYETRNPLVQSVDQPSDLIRAQARAWIWKRWQAHTKSYLEVQTHDDHDNTETTTYFISGSDTSNWHVTLKVHRTVLAEDSTSNPGRRIIEDELFDVDHLIRVEPPLGEQEAPRPLPDTGDVPSLQYRLQFLDYGNRDLRIL